jgi:hypothetical protein
VARAIFHGQRGELRQRYREGQEDQLGALGLVVNAVVLWTTRYLDAALARFRDSSTTVRPEESNGSHRRYSTTSTCSVGTTSPLRTQSGRCGYDRFAPPKSGTI